MAKRLVENRMILGGKKMAVTANDSCHRCHGRGLEGIDPIKQAVVICRCSTVKDNGPASPEEVKAGRWESAQ